MRILLAPKFKPSLLGEKFPKKLLQEFQSIRDDVGCTNVSLWAAPHEASGPENQTQGLIATTYPLLWVQRYALSGFSSVDPVLVECLYSNSPLILDFNEKPAPELEKFYAAVNRAGLGRYSISIPIRYTNTIQTVTTFNFAGTHNKANLSKHEHLVTLREYAFMISTELFADANQKKSDLPNLTQRETVILNAMAKGASYQEIADSLSLSRWTVVAHTKSIRTKIGARNNSEALSKAIESGIVSL